MAAAPLVFFVDGAPFLDAALADLSPGQLIKDEHLSLMDLMSAIEVGRLVARCAFPLKTQFVQIMDPRTDSYLSLKKSHPEDGDLPRFDPTEELLPEELLWILDQLLRLEVRLGLRAFSILADFAALFQTTFHDGHPLASTLLSCRYIRPSALAALCHTRATFNHSKPPPEYRTTILRAMLLAVIKCTEMIWEELCKAQVYEVRPTPRKGTRTLTLLRRCSTKTFTSRLPLSRSPVFYHLASRKRSLRLYGCRDNSRSKRSESSLSTTFCERWTRRSGTFKSNRWMRG
jgi:hypothetical protein